MASNAPTGSVTVTVTTTGGASNGMSLTVAPPGTAASFQIQVSTGLPSATLTLSGSANATAQTDSNGNYTFTVPVSHGGHYTVTPSMAGYTFSPASLTFDSASTGNQTAPFAATPLSFTIPPDYAPDPAPAPNPPAAVSDSVQACDDISGAWSGIWPGETTLTLFTLSQTGGQVSGQMTYTNPADPCGTAMVWQVTGQLTGEGTFDLVWSNPSPPIDACGWYGNVGEFTVSLPSCSQALDTITQVVPGPAAPPTDTGGTGGDSASTTARAAGPSNAGLLGPVTAPYGTSVQPRAATPGPGNQFYWSRNGANISIAADMQLSFDFVGGSGYVVLAGPYKTGNLTVYLTPTTGNPIVLLSMNGVTGSTPPVPSSNYINFTVDRTQLPSSTAFGSVTATWDEMSVTMPLDFWVFGQVFFSQYNTTYEDVCISKYPDTPITVWVASALNTSTGTCTWNTIQVNPTFSDQTIMNGSGISVSNPNVVLKPYSIWKHPPCPKPTGPPAGPYFISIDTMGNTLTTVTGQCGTVVSDATNTPSAFTNNNPAPPAGTGSLATVAPGPSQGGGGWLCADQVLLVDSLNRNDPRGLRTVVDECPICVGNHIDMYSSSHGCKGHDVGNYGTLTAIKTHK